MSGEWEEIAQPGDAVAVVNGIYVHRVGFTMRTFAVPGADPELFKRMLLDAGEISDGNNHATIWNFWGIWPNRSQAFYHYTADWREAGEIIANPKSLRFKGTIPGNPIGTAQLVPVDPVTGSGQLSVAEHNRWLSSLFGEEQPADQMDFSMLNSVDFSSLEDFLGEQAEKEGE
jgi:hypothetical protein